MLPEVKRRVEFAKPQTHLTPKQKVRFGLRPQRVLSAVNPAPFIGSQKKSVQLIDQKITMIPQTGPISILSK